MPAILTLLIAACQQRRAVQRSSSCCRPRQLLQPWQHSHQRLRRLQQLLHLITRGLRQPGSISCSCIWRRLNLTFLHLLLLQLPSAAMPWEARQGSQLRLIPRILILTASHT